MKKKMTVLMLTCALTIVSLTGCGGNKEHAEPSSDKAETSSAGKEDGGKISIGFTADYLSDFMSYVADGVEKACEENGVGVSVQDADFDVSKQLQQVENFINSGVDAVVIKPVDAEACQPISDACKNAGVPLVVVNTAMSAPCDSYVGSDHTYSGELQGEFLAEEMPKGGKVAILMGETTVQATTQRTDGVKAALEKAGGFEVVSEMDAGWMRDEAMDTVENWLNSGLEIDAIVANNDEMAIGASLVLEENNVDDVLVCGIDASEDALNKMKDGRLDMTVFQNGYQQGYQGVETAIQLINGETVEEFVDVPYEPVLPNQADEYLEKIGK